DTTARLRAVGGHAGACVDEGRGERAQVVAGVLVAQVRRTETAIGDRLEVPPGGPSDGTGHEGRARHEDVVGRSGGGGGSGGERRKKERDGHQGGREFGPGGDARRPLDAV